MKVKDLKAKLANADDNQDVCVEHFYFQSGCLKPRSPITHVDTAICEDSGKEYLRLLA